MRGGAILATPQPSTGFFWPVDGSDVGLFGSRGTERDLLHAPVHELSHEQIVFTAAIDRVHHAEFLRQSAGASELADNAAVELQLVDLTVIERFGVIRIR